MFRTLASGFLLLAATTAHSATITDAPIDKDPNVGLVVIQGELTDGDSTKANAAIQKYSKGIVLFESGGGNLLTGLEIGTTIRMKGFRTGVAPGALCASSCALAWLGGVERFLSPTSKLGFHAAYRTDGNTSRETGLGNALVGAYLTRIGLPLDAVIYITKAAPDDMTWLTPVDAKKAGIDLSVLDEGKPKAPLPAQTAGSAAAVAPAPPLYSGPIPAGRPTSPPSFDCGRATRNDEKAICGDAILARLDQLIDSKFRSLPKGSDSAGTRYWLRLTNAHRENCHSDALCILTVQKRALQLLGDGSIPPWVDEYKAGLIKSGIGSEWKPVLPTSVGECVNTSIVGLSDRFGSPLTPFLNEEGFDSGSAADFRNGGHVISYSKESVLLNSRKGDRVRMCLVSIPKDCPPGDDRGRTYRIINVRTRESVVLPDSQHMCGGA